MSPAKEAVLKAVESLPDDSAETESEILYRLYVRAKIAEGLKDLDEGRVVSEEEADRRIDEWLASYGPNEP
jgi:predicted transcriptional regulator